MKIILYITLNVTNITAFRVLPNTLNRININKFKLWHWKGGKSQNLYRIKMNGIFFYPKSTF